MKATIVDLRYHMNDILKALDRNESVTIMYRGQEKGVIIPSRKAATGDMSTHPFFGMQKDLGLLVEVQMEQLRGSRYDDI